MSIQVEPLHQLSLGAVICFSVFRKSNCTCVIHICLTWRTLKSKKVFQNWLPWQQQYQQGHKKQFKGFDSIRQILQRKTLQLHHQSIIKDPYLMRSGVCNVSHTSLVWLALSLLGLSLSILPSDSLRSLSLLWLSPFFMPMPSLTSLE